MPPWPSCDLGVNSKIVTDRLGHANETVTQQIYTHPSTGHDRAAAEMIARLIAEALQADKANLVISPASPSGVGSRRGSLSTSRSSSASPHPNHFADLDQVRDRLAAFAAFYNAIARPFTWKFTHANLSHLLRRINAHDKTEPRAVTA